MLSGLKDKLLLLKSGRREQDGASRCCELTWTVRQPAVGVSSSCPCSDTARETGLYSALVHVCMCVCVYSNIWAGLEAAVQSTPHSNIHTHTHTRACFIVKMSHISTPSPGISLAAAVFVPSEYQIEAEKKKSVPTDSHGKLQSSNGKYDHRVCVKYFYSFRGKLFFFFS